MLNIFLDTNVFLHLKPLGELPPKEIHEGEFQFWVPNKVIEELDRHKDSSESKLKRRARSALKLIEGLEAGPTKLNNGIALNWFQHDPLDSWDTWGLDKTRGDDIIIATILTFMDANQGVKVALLTRDSAIRMRAGRFGVTKLPTRPEHEQPEEPDSDKKEIERLKHELLKQQIRQPKLTATMIERGKYLQPAHLVVHHSSAKHFDEGGIKKLIQKEEADLNFFTETMFFQGIGHSSLFMPSAAAQSDYNARAREYLKKFKFFLEKTVNPYFQRQALTVPVQLALLNGGTSSATNVDIRLIFPIGLVGTTPPQEPTAPERPVRPTSALDRSRNPTAFGPNRFLQTPHIKLLKDGDASMRALRSGGIEVSFNFPEIKHHENGTCETIFLTFPSVAQAKSFRIQYEITCRELVDKTIGSLDVLVEVK